jgi:hypothetical protein
MFQHMACVAEKLIYLQTLSTLLPLHDRYDIERYCVSLIPRVMGGNIRDPVRII